jgi:hypothetical protein
MDKKVYYHASQQKDIKVLEPRISNHNKPLIYFSSKRENVLVYLSNAIEKFCKETNYEYDGIYSTWGPYSFTKEGLLQLEEYYKDALKDTYKGVSGYIYTVEEIPNQEVLSEIKDVYVTSDKVTVTNCEYIEDAYEEILRAYELGLINILKYEDLPDTKINWLNDIIPKEYNEANDHPEYKYFLENKFSHMNLNKN